MGMERISRYDFERVIRATKDNGSARVSVEHLGETDVSPIQEVHLFREESAHDTLERLRAFFLLVPFDAQVVWLATP